MSYPTLAEIKAFIGIEGAVEDELLQGYLDSSIGMVEKLTGRSFVLTMTSRSYVLRGRDIYAAGSFWLLNDEWYSITGITNWNAAGVAGLVDPNLSASDYRASNWGYVPGPPFQGIALSPDAAETWYAVNYGPTRTIEVSGQVGYTEECPSDLQLAIQLMCEGMYHKRKSRISAVSVSRSNAAIGEASWVPTEAVGILRSYIRFR